jgi:hypothetical protein
MTNWGTPDAPIIEPTRGFDHHGAETLAVEAGAAQYRRHHLVGEQIFEARFIAAACCDRGHVSLLLTCRILRSLAGKHVRNVTRVRKFRGKLAIGRTKFPPKSSRDAFAGASSRFGTGRRIAV